VTDAPTAPAARAPALSVRGVSQLYGSVHALRDVTFDVAPGTIHALVGANGSGKSTLIRIVAGVEPAASGELTINGQSFDATRGTVAEAALAGIRVVHQHSNGFPDLTVAENIAIGTGFTRGRLGAIRWRALHRQTEALTERYGLHVSPQTRLGDLAPAAQTLVAIARAFAGMDLHEHAISTDGSAHRDARRLIVLDEPTAALTAPEVELLLRGLRSVRAQGHAVVLVTHRLDEVVAAADYVTVLRDGRHVATRPAPEASHDDLVSMITGTSAAPTSAPAPANPLRDLVTISDLTVDGVSNASFQIRDGEILGLTGLLGSGRSTILEGLFGARRTRAGTVTFAGAPLNLCSPAAAMRAGAAFGPEQRERAVFPNQSLAENLSAAALPRRWRGLRIDQPRERNDAAVDTAAFGITAAGPDVAMNTLSGGNQQKAILARWMRRAPRLLLLDEPTLGVDVGARAEIHRMIREYVTTGRAALYVSSDVEELCVIADRILVLHDGSIAHELTGAAKNPDTVNQLVHQSTAA
jgi:ribose transport system ATP-binding protein